MDVLTATQIEQLMHFREAATAWLFVGFGAFFIAITETWQPREEYEWPTSVFWVLVVAMITACAANTAVRMQRGRGIVRRARQ